MYLQLSLLLLICIWSIWNKDMVGKKACHSINRFPNFLYIQNGTENQKTWSNMCVTQKVFIHNVPGCLTFYN